MMLQNTELILFLVTFIMLHNNCRSHLTNISYKISNDNLQQVTTTHIYTTEDYISPADIIPICDAYITVFADASSNFTRCFLINSRPIDLCELCIGEYLLVSRAYDDLEQASGRVPEQGALKVVDCSSWILNADRVMAIQQTKEFYEDLWDSAQCKNCFESYSYDDYMIRYKTADYFLTFQELDAETQECFNNYTLNISNPSLSGVSEACVDCREKYDALNEFYVNLDTEYGTGLCMDIVDSMNYTRLVWSTEFNCTGNTRQDGITITISVLFLFMPAVFYIASHIHYQRLEKKIVKQNRMRRIRTASGRGSVLDVLDSESFHTAYGNLNNSVGVHSGGPSVEYHTNADNTGSPELFSSLDSTHPATPHQSYDSVNSNSFSIQRNGNRNILT